MKNTLTIAIDGPAGAGKTTIAKALSKKLDILYLNTGAMYRAFAYKFINNNLELTENIVNNIVKLTDIQIKYQDGLQRVILDNTDVTDFLYTDQISEMASKISTFTAVREKLVEVQRKVAEQQPVIMDGRDIGSVVLPMANFKFYLDADVNVRAMRRYNELVKKGENTTFEEVLADMKERDYRDTTRAVSPLKKCDDSIIIDCTKLNIEQVIEKFLEYIKEK